LSISVKNCTAQSARRPQRIPRNQRSLTRKTRRGHRSNICLPVAPPGATHDRVRIRRNCPPKITEVWFYLEKEPRLRGQHTRRGTSKNLHSRCSEARQENSCPRLTKTYHGSRLTGQLPRYEASQLKKRRLRGRERLPAR